MNKGTRSAARPLGDGSNPKESIGNQLADSVGYLCWLQRRSGGKFSIENPKSSWLWHHPRIADLLFVSSDVDFDQCMFGLRPPHAASSDSEDVRIKKPTRLRTSLSTLSCLSRACQGGHTHFRCLGHVHDSRGKLVSVARAAGQYPDSLCTEWAKEVERYVADSALETPSGRAKHRDLRTGGD